MSARRPLRVHETVLYAEDVRATAPFYTDVLGLRAVDGPDPHSAAFRLADGGVLLLFDPRRSAEPGRFVPSHGALGAGHVAFMVQPGTLDEHREALHRHGVAIEREVTWPRGGRSLYVRDPAGTSVELVDGEIWSG